MATVWSAKQLAAAGKSTPHYTNETAKDLIPGDVISQEKQMRRRFIDNLCFLPWRSALAHSRKTRIFWMRSPRSKNKVPKTSLLCKSQPQMTFSEITHDCSRNSKTLAFSEGKAVPSQVHMLIPRLDYGSDHQARHSFFYNQFVA